MTGYGRARRSAGETSADVELRSVNGRYLSIKCRLPSDLLRLESALEGLVRKQLARGSVEVSVRVRTERRHVRPRIDEDVLAVYQRAAQRLDGAGGGSAGAALLSLPGVVSLVEDETDEGAVDRLVLGAARTATEELCASRAAEGERLGRAMERELARVEKQAAAVARRAPAIVRDQRGQLRRRLGELLDGRGLSHDDPVLAREVALLADRSDVTEELDRLGSHLAALRKDLGAAGPVGRRIDFLLQEIGREVNTIGSKCGDARVVGHVVQLKSSVEKLREQAANIE